MTSPRVFLDQDLRRYASYEAARSVPLPPEVALSSTSAPLLFSRVCRFYGIARSASDPIEDYLLMDSLRVTLGAASYEDRLAHYSGSVAKSPLTVTDLRSPAPDHVLSSSPPIPPLAEGHPSDKAAEGDRIAMDGGVNEPPSGLAPGPPDGGELYPFYEVPGGSLRYATLHQAA